MRHIAILGYDSDGHPDETAQFVFAVPLHPLQIAPIIHRCDLFEKVRIEDGDIEHLAFDNASCVILDREVFDDEHGAWPEREKGLPWTPWRFLDETPRVEIDRLDWVEGCMEVQRHGVCWSAYLHEDAEDDENAMELIATGKPIRIIGKAISFVVPADVFRSAKVEG